MNDLERLLARDAIRDLAHRYAVALDARDLEGLVGLFVEDVQVGRSGRGREALRADFERQLRAIGVSVLYVCNHVVDFDDDDHAHGIVYTRAEIQDGPRFVIQAIQYHDRYERRQGRWYFVRRRHRLVYGAEVGENPMRLPPANWPESYTGRGTLPGSLPTWQAFYRRRRDPEGGG